MTSDAQPSGVRSSVHIAGHPIHPILIPFPIAFLVAAVAADVAYLLSADTFWARVSLWLLGAGVVTGLVAAIPGLVDFVTIERTRRHLAGWVHFLGNIAVIGVASTNWVLRVGRIDDFIDPWGVALSVATAVLLGVTGWTGGELAYRHQIGVVGH